MSNESRKFVPEKLISTDRKRISRRYYSNEIFERWLFKQNLK